MIFALSFFSCNTTEPPDDNKGNGLDTTSHTINWIVEDIGESGSILRDVAIISDTLAYAVGEIYRNDSLFNVAKWDGQIWVLKKLYYNQNSTISKIRGIFVNSLDNIWIAAGSIFHWDGVSSSVQLSFSRLDLSDPNGTVEKLWSSNSMIYGVGNSGTIVLYVNNQWQELESGTNINLRDVWGSPDGSIVWVAGFEDSYGTVFLRNTGNGFEKVLEITDPNMPHPPNEITHVFKSLWTDSADTVYLGAVGRVYAAPKNTTGYAKENIWWDYANETELPPATNIIRGTANNDVFVGGYLQFVRHWNGASWKEYSEIEGDGTWRSMSIKNDLVITVGENFSNGNARIARGYRIK